MARIITSRRRICRVLHGNVRTALAGSAAARQTEPLSATITDARVSETGVLRPAGQARLNAFFLPDLCNTRSVLILLVVSEALVLALTLLETGLQGFSWSRFTIVSFFVQWVCLLSVAVLCQLRVLLARLNALPASLLALLVIMLVAFTVSITGEMLWPLTAGRIDWHWVGRNVLVSLIFGAMAMRYFYVQSQWRLKTQAELKARLAALQANIRPHFFFNTLNTVASLIMVDPDKAEHLLLDLAQLFRAVLKTDDSLIPLAQEIELGRRYLAIEQVRLGDQRMRVEWQLPDPLPSLLVPQLLLQPLLENAVYHGIQPGIEGGYLHISLQRDADHWRLTIRNSRAHTGGEAGNRMAQDNIRARLAALGGGADLQLEISAAEYSAHLILPAVRETLS